MAKKKVYDSETGDVMEVGSVPVVTAKPINALIQGFCDTFTPCRREQDADEVYTLARIRDYFKCYTIPDPKWIDLLPDYLDALEEHGFKLRTSFAGESAIFVKWNDFPFVEDDEDDE